MKIILIVIAMVLNIASMAIVIASMRMSSRCSREEERSGKDG
jgi:flagellar basal body-associated protein FliL